MTTPSEALALEDRRLPENADVVIVGAGPAGATAGRLLARWGHRVVLLERHLKRRSFGESLPPSCDRILERIGSRADLDGMGAVRSTGNTVWWGGASAPERGALFGQGRYGYQVDRAQFDEVLRAGAQRDGAFVVVGASAREVRRHDSPRPSVIVERGGVVSAIEASWVIDATGRAGFATRYAPRAVPSETRMVAIVGVWEAATWDLPDDTHTLVESFPRGWAWSIPTSRTRRFVTVMLDPQLEGPERVRELDAAYATGLAMSPRINAACARGRLVGSPWACDASPYAAAPVWAPRGLRVGDAASCLDPLSSFGVKKALTSAWQCAVTVNTALRDPAITAHALDHFAAREEEYARSAQVAVAELAATTSHGEENPFWATRAAAHFGDHDEEGVRLRNDPGVVAALGRIRRAQGWQATLATNLVRIDRPMVRENRIVLAPHLRTSRFPDGVRFIRNVDVVTLAELAPSFQEVPDLFEAYLRHKPGSTLPDFLGALATLVADGVLVLLDSEGDGS